MYNRGGDCYLDRYPEAISSKQVVTHNVYSAFPYYMGDHACGVALDTLGQEE